MRRVVNDILAANEPKRKLAVSEYLIPSRIRLEGERLFWQPVEQWKKVKPIRETFADFLALAEPKESDRDVLDYARRWGVLNLCRKHLLPVSHDNRCKPFERHTDSQGEPVSQWRCFARLAGAILNLSQDLTDGRIGKGADWRVVADFDRLLPLSSKAATLAELGMFGSSPKRKATPTALKEAALEGRAVIADFVNQWVELGNVRPQMLWQTGEPTVLLAGGLYRGSLFGALAVHLLELAGRYVIASCSGCRKFYHPEIRPKSGQDRFCRQCRDQCVPVALASHRRNVRKTTERAQKRAKTARER
jgi:hypothetical protein